MRIIRTGDFDRAFAELPQEIQELYRIQEERFYNDWNDPRLHLKKVRELKGVYSFRITRRYRVFFYLQDTNTAVFFNVEHRKDAYR